MSARSTIEDVAREAGVSVATVSRALRDLPNVAPATKAKVERAARELGYQPHTAASWLASGRTSTIGLVAPYYTLWYTSQVISGVARIAAQGGYDLVIYAADTAENRSAFLKRLAALSTRVDGLLLVDFFLTNAEETLLAAEGVTTVSLGEQTDHFESLAIDNVQAAHDATDHLLSLGHTRIAVGGAAQIGLDGSPVLVDRMAGYKQAMSHAGLAPGPELPGLLTIQGGVEAMRTLHEMRHGADADITAALFFSDEMAMGALGEAHVLGLRVPADLSIVGIDDHDLSESFDLTTVRQPVCEMGEMAAQTLLAAIESGGAHQPDHHVVSTELVIRGSSGPHPASQ